MKQLSLFRSLTFFWVLLFLGPLPIIYYLFSLMTQLQDLNALESNFERIYGKYKHLQNSQQNAGTVAASLKHSDPHYIDKHIETLTFLLPEIKKIEALESSEESVHHRLKFLKEGYNRLEFTEEAIRSNAIFREIEEKQQRAIELNEEDLKNLLCLIEGITIWPYGPKEGRPQLIIQDFQLSKKAISAQEKVFVVTMQLIKRENMETSK